MFRFPRTNFHELNLDWILNKIKQLEKTVKEHLVNYPYPSNENPKPLGTPSPGTSEKYARADHVHQDVQIPYASNSLPKPLGTANAGSSFYYSRADHVHPLQSVPSASSTTPLPLGTANSGSSLDYSRADHVHKMPTFADVGALSKIESVWTNPDTTQAFPQTRIDFDTAYNGFIILYLNKNDANRLYEQWVLCRENAATNAYIDSISITEKLLMQRLCLVYNTRKSITIYNCNVYDLTSDTSSQNNNYLVPEAIYGFNF